MKGGVLGFIGVSGWSLMCFFFMGVGGFLVGRVDF